MADTHIPQIPLERDYRVISCHEETEFPLAHSDALLTRRHIAKHAKDPNHSAQEYNFGDQYQNAQDVIKAWWKDSVTSELIEEITRNNGGALPGKLVLVVPSELREADRLNSLAITYALRLKGRLEKAFQDAGHDIPVRIARINALGKRKGRTHADALGRLIARYDHEQIDPINPGDKVIFVDDHIQNGRTAMDVGSFLAKWGANLVAVTALSRHPECSTLGMSPQIRDTLRNFITDLSAQEPDAGKTFANLLKEINLSFDTLASRDAMTFLAYLMPRNPQNTRQFEQLLSGLRGGKNLPYKSPDDLENVFAGPPMTLGALQSEIRNRMAQIPPPDTSGQQRH